MSETVLVTGNFGFIGSAVVRPLAADGRTVVATEEGSRANRRSARWLSAAFEVHRAGLTEPGAANRSSEKPHSSACSVRSWHSDCGPERATSATWPVGTPIPGMPSPQGLVIRGHTERRREG